MPPPRRLLVRRLYSSFAFDPTQAPTPATISTAADLAAVVVRRSRRLESSLFSMIPRAVLFHPDCARLTFALLLPSLAPSLRFLRFLASQLPAPAPAAASSPPLPGVDAFLLGLPPRLAADAADILASHLGIHPSLHALNAASRAALRSGRPDLVFRLFSSFSASPAFPGDSTTVGCLARAYIAEGRPLDGLGLLRDAARRGSPVPADAAAKLVSAFAAVGNFAKVSATLHLMIAAGCPPNSVVYRQIIHALFTQGMDTEAMRVFREIKVRGYDIDRIMYTVVIDGLCKIHRFGDAQQVWDEMMDKGMEPNQYAYCIFVNNYFRAGNFEEARKVYDKMLHKGFKESNVSCNILIEGFCVHGRVDEAVEVFEEMYSKGIEHDVITYNTLIKGLCKVGKLAQAIGMYERLLSSGLEPTVRTFSPLIDTMCEEGHVDAAVDLIKSMHAKGLKLVVWSNNSIINGFCKVSRPDEGMAWLAGMLKGNIKPPEWTFNSLVESLSTCGRLDGALMVLTIMFKVGFDLGRFSCTILVDKLCSGNVSYSHQLDDISRSNS